MGRLFMFWLLLLPVWLWALLCLWTSSGGVIDIVQVMLLVFTAVPAAFVWVISGFVCVQQRSPGLLLMWLLAPVVCVAALTLSASDVPLIVRFHLSEPALRQYAETGPSETSVDDNPQPIGLFHVEKVWRHVAHSGFCNR